VRTAAKLVAQRLRNTGWLLPTARRGVWEFAPGSHAGPIGHGDPTMPLRVALRGDPTLPAVLALATAAWAHGFADRVPTRIDVALPSGVAPPADLKRATHLTRFTSNLDPVVVKGGIPAHRPETILAQLATTPGAARSWASVLQWLPELCAGLMSNTLMQELAHRGVATRARTGYLLSGLRPDLAGLLADEPSRHNNSVVRFGPRTTPPVRYNARWRVVDSLLPSDPTTWHPAP
jgi:hypothetical protein